MGSLNAGAASTAAAVPRLHRVLGGGLVMVSVILVVLTVMGVVPFMAPNDEEALRPTAAYVASGHGPINLLHRNRA